MVMERIGSQKWVTKIHRPEDELPFRMVGAATARTAFRSIQSVNLVETFQVSLKCAQVSSVQDR